MIGIHANVSEGVIETLEFWYLEQIPRHTARTLESKTMAQCRADGGAKVPLAKFSRCQQNPW